MLNLRRTATVFIVAMLTNTLSRAEEAPVIQRGEMGWEFFDGHGSPWIKEAGCGIKLTDGTFIQSRDPRYEASIERQGKQTTLKLTDTKKQLDQSWVVQNWMTAVSLFCSPS
jgi:hypothetical protein